MLEFWIFMVRGRFRKSFLIVLSIASSELMRVSLRKDTKIKLMMTHYFNNLKQSFRN